jgi:hypothetical protein
MPTLTRLERSILCPVIAATSLCTSSVFAATHYIPAELNELSVQLVLQGRVDTARILLERAAVLSPENKVIRSNLNALKSLHGEVSLEPQVGLVAPANRGPELNQAKSSEMTEIPPLWPLFKGK